MKSLFKRKQSFPVIQIVFVLSLRIPKDEKNFMLNGKQKFSTEPKRTSAYLLLSEGVTREAGKWIISVGLGEHSALVLPPCLARKAQSSFAEILLLKDAPLQGIEEFWGTRLCSFLLYPFTNTQKTSFLNQSDTKPRIFCRDTRASRLVLGDRVLVFAIPSGCDSSPAGKSRSIWENLQLTTLDRSVRAELAALSHLFVKEGSRMSQLCYEHQQRQQRTGKSWRQSRAQEIIPRTLQFPPSDTFWGGKLQSGKKYFFVQAKYFLPPLLSGPVL